MYLVDRVVVLHQLISNNIYLSHPSLVPSRTSFSSISLLRNVQKLILRARGRTSLSSVSLLWNVQTLIIKARDTHHFPSHLIWQMPKLRHLKINEISLPDPSPLQSDQQDTIVLQNLQTLQLVKNFKLSDEVCKRIPNLKKLKIEFDDHADYCLYNLDRLHKLESLNCTVLKISTWGDLQTHTLPTSLKKLTLSSFILAYEDYTMIGRLPHLEVLVLNFCGSKEWNPVEGGFCRLKFLDIICPLLEHWNADSSHFPVLETLFLREIYNLHVIPSGVGEIPTLRLICLDHCSESAAISAARILEEQESAGNEDFQVILRFYKEDDLKSFRERMEDELGSFTSKNLTVSKGASWKWMPSI